MGSAATPRHTVRRIVSNTGPLLHLSETQALQILSHAGEIHIPKAVEIEMKLLDSKWRTPSWITVDPLEARRQTQAQAWQQAGLLDLGEAEAIALAHQIQADWLLTDDAAARLFAQALGLEVHGSVGVVLWAAVQGYLRRQQAEDVLDRLAQSSLWISPRVLAEAKAALQQLGVG